MRLTRNGLKRIVSESVRRIMRESYEPDYYDDDDFEGRRDIYDEYRDEDDWDSEKDTIEKAVYDSLAANTDDYEADLDYDDYGSDDVLNVTVKLSTYDDDVSPYPDENDLQEWGENMEADVSEALGDGYECTYEGSEYETIYLKVVRK